jgi:hypothetical protein
MNFVLATVAFLALQAATSGYTGAAELTDANRDEPQATTSGPGVNANGERRICRRLETTRSHMQRRLCMTAREWREFGESRNAR